MAIIGNGAQSEFQAMAFKALLGVSNLRLYDIDPAATERCARNLAGKGFAIVRCRSPEEAVEGAQIITTATADKQYATILTDNMVGAGVHINAVGGDCPGKTELHKRHPAALGASSSNTRRRRALRAKSSNCRPITPVTELWQVMTGAAPGRRDARRDHAVRLGRLRDRGFFGPALCARPARSAPGLFEELDLLADPDDPRDLFGMILRADTPQSIARRSSSQDALSAWELPANLTAWRSPSQKAFRCRPASVHPAHSIAAGDRAVCRPRDAGAADGPPVPGADRGE